MIKIARKQSSDPAQEKLRENKALWNKEVSTFISDLINFKKTMNGMPSKFFPEKSSIKEPIEADPATIIGVLAGDFQEIAQKGNSIISEQINYSKIRRKSKPKGQTESPAPVPATGPNLEDLSQKLTASYNGYSLLAEGSNPVTRFFTRLFNPTIGFGDAADLRRARVSMLNYCADSHYKLEKFQVLIVASAKNSITEAHKKLEGASHDWRLVAEAYQIYKSSKAVSAPDKGGPVESEKPKQDKETAKLINEIDKSVNEIKLPKAPSIIPDKTTELEEIKNLVLDYRTNHQAIRETGLMNADSYLSELDSATEKFITSRGKNVDSNYPALYQQTLSHFNSELGTNATSFKSLIDQFNQTDQVQPPVDANAPKVAMALIEKVAQDLLKKWIGKTRHQLIPQQTSPLRLASYKEAAEIRTNINMVMDSLENGLDEDELAPLMKEINTQFIALRRLMTPLHLSARVK